jgi:ribosomal protein S18 acetylase RimI-like enzyme
LEYILNSFIREISAGDAAVIAEAFRLQGWNKPESQYLCYLDEHRSGKRTVLVAEAGSDQPALEFAGYLTIIWDSEYPPFKAENIPEIVDFNVLIKFRRLGIGSALMDEAERLISMRSPVAGIGVGLPPDYGPAHILYIKRGYIPDGKGLYYEHHHLTYGESCTVNDDLTLMFTKRVR